MKKLIALLVIALITAAQVTADIGISTDTNHNVKIVLNPDGSLDASPVWTSTGPGIIQVNPTNVLNATFITSTAGTAVVTVSATARGTPLVQTVTITVAAAPGPATTLGAGTLIVPK